MTARDPRTVAMVVEWSQITFDPPVPLVRRDQVYPGDVVQSSHGYRLLITEVQLPKSREDGAHVGFTGHLHGDPGAPTTTERYPRGSLIPLLRAGATP